MFPKLLVPNFVIKSYFLNIFMLRTSKDISER